MVYHHRNETDFRIKKIYIALKRVWQNGSLKRALCDKEQPQLPDSLLRKCPGLCFCMIKEVAEEIIDA